MIEYLTALLLWLLVLIPSSIIASAIARKHKQATGFVIQASFLTFSLLLMLFLRIPANLNPAYLSEAFVTGFLLSLALNLAQKRLGVEINPPDLPEGKLKLFFLFLILAPLGEEALNRGLVEGYLLSEEAFWGAVVFSAALFALPHWMAFKGNPIGKASAVSGVFLVGLSVGYTFAVTNSLLTAFLFHSAANLAGFTVESLEKSGT